jgi:tetratricopeptide (TPR) repeat protein
LAGAGQELQLGIQSFNQSKYDDAIAHLEKALQLDPSNINAHFYLARAYNQQYVPGVDKPANVTIAEHAIEHYDKVLDLGTSRIESKMAAKGIVNLYSQMGKFDEAKDYCNKAKELDPLDPESYYAIAVIDWTVTSEFRQQKRASLGMKPEESLPAKDQKVCTTVKEKNWDIIAEGIDNLNQALQINSAYADAMAQMDLLYRERADVQCEDPASRKADLKTADEWKAKALATKKSKPAHAPS